MNKVKILTDSTSDLYRVQDRDLYKEMDVDILPLWVSFDGEHYLKDGVDLQPNELFKKVEEVGHLPKSSCASPQEIVDFFKIYIDQGYDVVYIGIGAELSGGFKSASIAAEEFPKDRVYIVDSANLSSAIGLVLYKASQLRDEGKSAKEIAEIIPTITPRVRASFIIDTLDYLYMGGRCNGMSKVVGTLLALKPWIRVIDGKLTVAAKRVGKKKAIQGMIDAFAEDWNANNVIADRIMVTHPNSDDEAEWIIDKLVALGVPKDIIISSHAGCVISTHCGPRTIGILYITKE